MQSTRNLRPPVDIHETDKSWHIIADIPGVAEDAVELTVEKNTLYMQAPINDSSSWKRSFTIGHSVDTSAITAKMNDGVLQLELPKHPSSQPRKIAIAS